MTIDKIADSTQDLIRLGIALAVFGFLCGIICIILTPSLKDNHYEG